MQGIQNTLPLPEDAPMLEVSSTKSRVPFRNARLNTMSLAFSSVSLAVVMRNRLFKIAIVAQVFVCLLTSNCLAQIASPDDKNPKELPVAGVAIFSGNFPTVRVPINLGELTVGTKAEFVVEVRNSTDKDFIIKDVRSSDNCLDIETTARKIEAKKSIDLKATLDVPTVNRLATGGQQITLVQEDGSILPIDIDYRIAGLCCFTESYVVKAVREGQNEIDLEIPIVVTEPVDLSSVSVVGSGDFSDATVTIALKDGKPQMKTKVDTSLANGQSLSGYFRVQNSVNDASDQISVRIGVIQKVRVLPSLVQFSKEGNDWKTTAMVRVDKESLSSDPVMPNFSVACKWNELPVATTVETIGRGVARVSLTVKESDLFDQGKPKFALSDGLHWQIAWDGGIGEVSTAACCIPLSEPSTLPNDNSLFQQEQAEIAYANCYGWRKYDVLIKESSFVPADDGQSVEAVDNTIRFAVDWEEKQIFLLVKKENSEKPDAGSQLELIAKSKGIAKVARIPGRSQPLLATDLKMVLANSKSFVPDIRFCGIQPFPLGIEMNFEEFGKVLVLATRRLSDNTKVVRLSDGIQISTIQPSSTLVRVFDSSTLLMKRMYARTKDSVIPFDQSISWIEKDGIFLPSQIVLEKLNVETQKTKMSTWSILWRSVNEPLDGSLFDPKVLDDFKKLQELVDEEKFREAGCLNTD